MDWQLTFWTVDFAVAALIAVIAIREEIRWRKP